MSIRTPRLDLIPATAEMLQAELLSPRDFQDLIHVDVPESWPPALYDPDAIRYIADRLTAHDEPAAWWLHYIVRRETPTTPALVVGAGGYKGPPHNYAVEVGYSILPEHRRLGYASEATEGLVRRAFARPEIRRVVAHTLPDLRPSIGVLERCGFRCVGEGTEEGAILFELRRADWDRCPGPPPGQAVPAPEGQSRS